MSGVAGHPPSPLTSPRCSASATAGAQFHYPPAGIRGLGVIAEVEMSVLPLLAALISVPASVGYPLLFAFVAAESAGAFVPGETSLIVAGAVAASGRLSLPLVIVVAAAAAILGDNVGYVIGRRGLRPLVDRPGRWTADRRRLFERGEVFFARRGSAAVFFGRWLPGLRVAASWLAGANRMQWWRFLFWNALGGITWAASIGALGYVLGRSAAGPLGAIGFVAVGFVAVVYVIIRVRRGRRSS